MAELFKRPVIQFSIGNPHVRMGRTLTLVNFEADGFALIRISCPDVPDWKPVLFWVKGFTRNSLAAPVNKVLVLHGWYFFGIEKQLFQVADSNWLINIPTTKSMKSFEVFRSNSKLGYLSFRKKIFSYKKPSFTFNLKPLFIFNFQRLIYKLKIKIEVNNAFRLSFVIPNIKNIIYLKCISLNPQLFYKNKVIKDE